MESRLGASTKRGVLTLSGAGLAVTTVAAVAVAATSDDPPAAAASSARPAVTHPVRIDAGISQFAAGADGSLRAATDFDNTEGRHSVPVIQRVSANGVRLASQRVIPKSTKQVLYSGLRTALIPSGAVVAYHRDVVAERGPVDTTRADVAPPPIRLRSLALDGTVLADEALVTDGGEDFFAESAFGGPTGAAAVTVVGVRTRADDFQRRWLAFKPAGSTHFGTAVRAADFPDGEGPSEVVLGPDGGGAVVIGPPFETSVSAQPAVRRISPSGELGPPMPLPVPNGRLVGVDAAFGPTGTLLITIGTSKVGGDDGSKPAGLYAATLAPGATSPSAVVAVPGAVDSGGGDSPAVALGPDDRSVVVTPRQPSGIRVFEGTGADLHQTKTYPSSRRSSVEALFSPSGALSIIWAPQAEEVDRAGVSVASRTATGSLGPARLAVAKRKGGVGLSGAVQLVDGRVALAYGWGSRAYVGTLRP